MPRTALRLIAPLRRVLSLVAVLLTLLFCAPLGGAHHAFAQGEAAEQSIDYADWEAEAKKAEATIGDSATLDADLEVLRAELADWRNRLNSAQTANSARIGTVREQIAALGPAPTDGGTEADEIAKKRQELADQLGKLQAPAIAAEEGYRRADGLIREIDRILREHQADQLMQLWPSPLNPGNWPEAAIGLTDTVVQIWGEAQSGWSNARARAGLVDNLPLIALLLLAATACTVFARRWIEAFADRLQGDSSGTRRQVFGLIASFGQVVVPTLGMVALTSAALLTGMLGTITSDIIRALPALGIAIFGAIWLGGRTFPRHQEAGSVLELPSERRTEGRFESAMMGVVIAAEILRELAMAKQGYSNAVTAVVSFPILVAGGVLLWRMGGILARAATPEDGDATYAQTIVRILSRASAVIGVAGPVLAAFGYVAAGKALIFPGMMTLGLLALLLILQKLLTDLWQVLLRRADARIDGEGLVPVLMGFGLTLLAVPVLALIWGARISDLTEVWTRFRAGFQLGESRISPTDFLIFALLFGIGYMATRLFQGALRSTILPRTKMEQGGQNALVSGAGYLGIFLAALIAINATGINLSGLAIVASALSVGIGFGLQNIVQNFVSGIILMIERPVSEGDWISVGTTEGIVKTISVRSTRIQTFDRSMVVVPNADLVSQRVTNMTRFSLAGRLIVPISVAWGQDSRQIEKILRDVAESQPMVVLNPPPTVLLQGFVTGALNFEIRVILRDVNFSGQVKNDINHQVVERFVAEGILLPGASNAPTPTQELARAVDALALLHGAPRPEAEHVAEDADLESAAPQSDDAPGSKPAKSRSKNSAADPQPDDRSDE